MKTTLELPDTLLTELKLIAARERRRLRDVVEEVVALGLRTRRHAPEDDASAKAQAEQWLEQWHRLGRRIEAESVDPRSCVDIVLADRR